MSKIGRNERCPCGSGRKYKSCCLSRDAGRASRQLVVANAVRVALDWLEDRCPGFLEAATEEFFGGLPAGLQERLYAQPDVRSAMRHHVPDWALGNTEVELEDEEVVAVAEVLARPGSPCGLGSPYAVALAVAAAPLRLWRVEQVAPTVVLRDALDDTVVTLADADPAEFADAGALVAARIFEHGVLLRHFWLPWLLDEDALERVKAAQQDYDERRELMLRTGPVDDGEEEAFDLARVLADLWLEDQVGDLESNDIVDEFEILDRAAVEAGFIAGGADIQTVDGELHFNFYGDPEGVEDLEEPHQCEDPEHCDQHDFGGVNHLYYGTGVVADSIIVITAYPEEADWAKAWIEQNLGGSARYLGRSGPADTETRE